MPTAKKLVNKAAKPVPKPVKKPVAKKPAVKAKRKPNPALMKPIQPDAVLAVIVGSKPIPRSQTLSKLPENRPLGRIPQRRMH